MGKLIVRYEPDPQDDVGQLWFALTTDQFAGTGYFWSYREGIVRLAKQLSEFPLAGPASETWGYEDTEGDNTILGLRITQVNGKGDLAAEVQVADLYEPRQRLKASFATKYSEVAAFAGQLQSLASGTANEAVLLSA